MLSTLTDGAFGRQATTMSCLDSRLFLHLQQICSEIWLMSCGRRLLGGAGISEPG